jgi:hypothetical protein
LLDSGTLYNAQSGFLGKGIQLGKGRGGGKVTFKPGEWKTIGFTGDDLKKNIFPLPMKPPAPITFSLLGFLSQAGDRLSSVAEILSGEPGGANERPTTTLARIEQGLKVFSSVHKRLFRGFRDEYKKLFRLNRLYLQPKNYFTVLDKRVAIPKDDYDSSSCDVLPVADPTDLSSTQKLLKAQMLYEMRGQGFNDAEIKKRLLEALQVEDIEALLNAPEAPPDPKVVLESEKLGLERSRLEFDMEKFRVESREIDARIEKTLAQAIESIAKAEAAEIGPQLEIYKAELQSLSAQKKAESSGNRTQ